MEQEELFDALERWNDYNRCCGRRRINDDLLEEKVKYYLNSINEDELKVLVSTFIREYFVSEEAIKQGCGPGDIGYFLRWLEDDMDIFF